MRVIEVSAKSILQSTKLGGFDYSINPYVGCTHGCRYCYARYMKKWRNYKEEWGEFIEVKKNAPELAQKESRDKKGSAILSTVCDPYMPIESYYKLTRRVLEKLNPEMRISILTKSDLVLRDVDVLKRFRKAEVGVTITTLDEKFAKIWEPNAPLPAARVEALRRLSEEGIATFCFVGPILPQFTNVEKIVEKVAPFVKYFMFDKLNLHSSREEVFATLKEKFPAVVKRYELMDDEFWAERGREINALGKEKKEEVYVVF